MAANYAETPSEEQKQAMIDFWRVFSRLYPCGDCAAHMRQKLQQLPPNEFLNSNKEYSTWLCKFHNLVNTDLGKDLLDCTNEDIVVNRWRSSEYCGCDTATAEVNGDALSPQQQDNQKH
ncbi:hypothetical protein RFI_06367 [Reticulomyxa filosa]|uniref:Sulfhydryl oxidase n=1 Tax=Reticulomyxa filosa TaxID=46433 RepID=X6NXZ6_RETFI|nr:hypothetical protein RFI_06367 [Reticulomyxa filosa]|eukprot:ETO30753.1 hypothetical protein RFI_06367 [Reticulomyxa filosa]